MWSRDQLPEDELLLRENPERRRKENDQDDSSHRSMGGPVRTVLGLMRSSAIPDVSESLPRLGHWDYDSIAQMR